jgi:hypothetical protein
MPFTDLALLRGESGEVSLAAQARISGAKPMLRELRANA